MFTFMGNHTITGTDYSLYGYGYGARLADLNKGSSSTGHAEMMWVIKGPDGQLYRPETLPDDLNAYLHYPSGIGFDGWRMEFTVKLRNQGDHTSWQEIVANATGSSATKVVEDAPQVFRWHVEAAPLSVSGNPIGMFEIYKYTNQSTFANDLSPEEINLGNIISHSGLNPSINAVWPVYNHALTLGTVRVLYDGNTSYSVPVEGENLIIAEYGPDVSMQAFISAFNDQTPPDLNANWVNASDPSRGLDPGDDFPLDQGYNSNEGSFEGKQPKAYALNFGHVEMFLDTDGLNGNQYSGPMSDPIGWVDQTTEGVGTLQSPHISAGVEAIASWKPTFGNNTRNDGTVLSARLAPTFGWHWVTSETPDFDRTGAASAYSAASELVASWSLPHITQEIYFKMGCSHQ